MDAALFNEYAERTRIEFVQPALEKAAKALHPYPLALVHGILMSAYSTCLFLTNGDGAVACGMFREMAVTAVDAAERDFKAFRENHKDCSGGQCNHAGDPDQEQGEAS
jgi:hypothetical protein